jgi:WD40 repeat protein
MAVALSPDGQRVAAGGGSPDGKGVVHLWNAASGTSVWSVGDHAAEVLAVAFAPDGKSLACASADGLIKLRDPQTGSVARTLPGHVRGGTSLAFSADGAALACGGGDGTTSLWEIRTGLRVRIFRPAYSQAGTIGGDRPITSIALSRDGETLATCTAGVNQTFAEPVRIWDVRTGELKRQFSEPAITGRPMALSPDGAVLATGGKTVRLWDARTGKPLRELFGHLKRTQSITFSADGRLLVSGGSYGTTNAWEVATGRHLVTLFAFPERRNGTVEEEWLAYHPDGYYDGSPGVDRLLAWRVGDELLTPESLGPRLHRPDRLADALKLRLR